MRCRFSDIDCGKSDDKGTESFPRTNRKRARNGELGRTEGEIAALPRTETGISLSGYENPPIAGLSRQSLQNVKTADWVVEPISKLGAHHAGIEPVSEGQSQEREFLDAETGRQIQAVLARIRQQRLRNPKKTARMSLNMPTLIASSSHPNNYREWVVGTI